MKDEFFTYLGEPGSLYGYERSYELVFLQSFFTCRNYKGQAACDDVAKAFREYYLCRKRCGLVADRNVDCRIANIEESSLSDVLAVIKANPYRVMHERKFFKIVPGENGPAFSLAISLVMRLQPEDYARLSRIVKDKLTLYFLKIDGKRVEQSQIKAKELSVTPVTKRKRVLSPKERFFRRVRREFKTKKLIGDIAVSDDEYEMLLEHLKKRFQSHLENGDKTPICDCVMSTALVQIGMRCYDSNYWNHVADAIAYEGRFTNHQKWVGESFMKTLHHDGKLALAEEERCDTILMHGFVADHYADKFFDFLFAYYNIDLERDLSRNRDLMHDLVAAMRRNDNTSRTYNLVEHTADAVRLNARGCRARICRMLRLMDTAFWGNAKPTSSSNRLTRLFWKWEENSGAFREVYEQAHAGGAKGKRMYSTPTLRMDLRHFTVTLLLPQQIVRFEDAGESADWVIKTESSVVKRSAALYDQGVTGFKTERSVWRGIIEVQSSNTQNVIESRKE